jgi:hypothetical protein
MISVGTQVDLASIGRDSVAVACAKHAAFDAADTTRARRYSDTRQSTHAVAGTAVGRVGARVDAACAAP